LRLPGIHLVFSLAERWLHRCGALPRRSRHGAVGPKHLPAYLEELVFRLDRRTARAVSHGFARLVEHAAQTPPITHRGRVDGAAS
jgi:hypothetical protein